MVGKWINYFAVLILCLVEINGNTKCVFCDFALWIGVHRFNRIFLSPLRGSADSYGDLLSTIVSPLRGFLLIVQ